MPVDLGAVGTVEVFQKRIVVDSNDDRMLAADGEVINDHVIVGAAADGGALFGERHLLYYGAAFGQDDLRHSYLSWETLSVS